MKLLVTGGAGFIGSNFVHYWIEKHPQDRITVVDGLTYAGNIENLNSVIKKIRFVEADINDRGKISEALKGIDTVVHFAAESHVDRSIFDPSSYWHSNVHGTQVLLEESQKAGVPRFHHISTDEVYGELPLDTESKFREDTPYAPRPDNLYAISKAEADRIVLDFYEKSDMFITISNCSNNYGPFQFPEKYIPIIITNLMDRMKVPLHGDGRNVRDWIHTRDHSSAIDKILEKGKRGETYLIGSGNDRNNGFIAEKVVELFGADSNEIKHVPDRHSNDRRYAIDAGKITNDLGWVPEFPRKKFEDGLLETIEWYKANEKWWRPLLKRKAVISDSSQSVWAFISLDRESGKTKFEFKQIDKNIKKSVVSDKDDIHFVEQNRVRHEIVMRNLKNKNWYKGSSENIKKEIDNLASNPSTFGYVEDLAARNDHLNGDQILSLEKIEHGNPEYGIYGIASWFIVSDKNGQKRMDGYYSWGWGPKSGAKLLVLLKKNGKITHLATQRELKFPTGEFEYTLPGGLTKLNEGLLDFIVRSFESDLGVNIKNGDVKIEKVISLGRVNPDAGMTNNKPNLYAIVAEVVGKKFKDLKDSDKKEEEKGIVLWPVSELPDFINKCDDAYLLASLARYRSLNVENNLKL